MTNSFSGAQTGIALTLLITLIGLPSMQVLVQSTSENISTIETKTKTENKTDSTTGIDSSSPNGMVIDVSIEPGSSTLTDMAFQPNPVNINVGDTVRWTYDDNVIHTVVEGNPATGDIPEIGFESEFMNTGRTFEHTFNQTGTFDFCCTLHPNMIGQVIVS